MRPELNDVLSLGCEMVFGENRNLVAQVALCNKYGQCVYNYYNKDSIISVVDYRNDITGITPNHLQSGKRYRVIHSEVADLIRGSILVGYNLDNDLRVLGLGHPEWNKYDTAYFCTERYPSLESLAQQLTGYVIQYGYNNAVKKARAAMLIYNHMRNIQVNMIAVITRLFL